MSELLESETGFLETRIYVPKGPPFDLDWFATAQALFVAPVVKEGIPCWVTQYKEKPPRRTMMRFRWEDGATRSIRLRVQGPMSFDALHTIYVKVKELKCKARMWVDWDIGADLEPKLMPECDVMMVWAVLSAVTRLFVATLQGPDDEGRYARHATWSYMHHLYVNATDTHWISEAAAALAVKLDRMAQGHEFAF